MRLLDGPLAGRVIDREVQAPVIVLPEAEVGGTADHHYDRDGHWLHSETYVGYESDETRARREAYWEQAYWDDLTRASDRSFR